MRNAALQHDMGVTADGIAVQATAKLSQLAENYTLDPKMTWLHRLQKQGRFHEKCVFLFQTAA